MKNACMLLMLHVVLSSSAVCHTGTLAGTVLDRQSRAPVPGASVQIEGTPRGAATDANGQFVIPDVATGSYTLSASAVGYVRQTLPVVLADTDTTRVDFLLVNGLLNFDEVTVTGTQNLSAASSGILRAIDFELRPRQSAQEMLRLVPGLVIAQHAGGGKAEQIFLRGFDADHGTDINLSVDGVPVNMVSHGHGQGYADLHFIIPEVVKGIEVYKGPYFAEFGDLATAGSARFATRDALESNLLGVEGGMFGTYRYLTMLNLPFSSGATNSYAAAEFYHTDGYFDTPIRFNRYNLFAKVRSHVSDEGVLDIWASGFGSGWDASGQIPQRAVDEGIIDRFGSIDPTEGGNTQRQNLSMTYLGTGGNTSTLLLQVYLMKYQFRLFSNFTFFDVDSVNGDGIEQDDHRTVLGARSEYTANHLLAGLRATTLFGSGFRTDDIAVQLWHQRHRERLENRADALVNQKNMSLYITEDVRFTDAIRLQLGLRGDYFVFDVDDLRRDSMDISGYTQQTILNPKANLVISPSVQFDVFLNFGGGFHSNDARVVVTPTPDPTLARAWGAETGVRWSPARNLTFSGSLWGLDLQNEFVYVGDEGTTEASGRTRRIGVDLEARWQIVDWLFADADLNLARGRFRDLQDGENLIPLAPTVTSTGGLTLRQPGGIEASLRYRHVGSRPANEEGSVEAKGSFVVDATAAYSFGNYRLQITGENLFNVEWNEAQFDTQSRLQGEPVPVSELHFTPGTPFNLRIRGEYKF